MSETKGHCKHGEFILTEGCPQCIQDSRPHDQEPEPIIVKVKYFSESTGQSSDREYTYYSADPLNIGDIVMVPMRDTTTKARVTAIDIPESEIASFKDKVKTIPANSIVKLKTAKDILEKMPIIDDPVISDALAELESPLEFDKEYQAAAEAEAESTAVALRPGEDIEARGYHEEALGLLEYATSRVIATAEDDKLANDDLVAIGKLKKVMENKRKEYLDPLKAQTDAIRETYNYLMAPVLDADTITRNKMKAFKLEQQRIAREAEELNRQALEVARKQAAINNGEFTTDIKPVEVETAPRLARTDQGTSGLVDEWKYEVIDIDLLPREYMIPDEAMLKSIAKKNHDKKAVPGVRFYNDPHIAVRQSRR